MEKKITITIVIAMICILPSIVIHLSIKNLIYDIFFDYYMCVKVSLTVVILICDWGNNITRESGLTGQEKGKKGEQENCITPKRKKVITFSSHVSEANCNFNSQQVWDI